MMRNSVTQALAWVERPMEVSFLYRVQAQLSPRARRCKTTCGYAKEENAEAGELHPATSTSGTGRRDRNTLMVVAACTSSPPRLRKSSAYDVQVWTSALYAHQSRDPCIRSLVCQILVR
ncbi:unnamed protein product [Effrenium voratum]|uniref:Uncharacterized protein n=1 Tax=Effrenium voratum TaxID=2562239 RepID=A0AA36IGG8_9DINO|nr:unnamed protein product [Effrenium voratum]CAJ1387328.1 unnamed protein product [Effrenium voratum]CAJ1424797.1 unnamed protein product [Effrenium voratum]